MISNGFFVSQIANINILYLHVTVFKYVSHKYYNVIAWQMDSEEVSVCECEWVREWDENSMFVEMVCPFFTSSLSCMFNWIKLYVNSFQRFFIHYYITFNFILHHYSTINRIRFQWTIFIRGNDDETLSLDILHSMDLIHAFDDNYFIFYSWCYSYK